jgi:hypothetical protein
VDFSEWAIDRGAVYGDCVFQYHRTASTLTMAVGAAGCWEAAGRPWIGRRFGTKRLIVLVAWLAIVGGAQTTSTSITRLKPTGDAQLEPGPDGVAIVYGQQDWNVDLSALPIRPDECEDSGASKKCAAHPGIGCLPCVREWQPVAWDEKREIFYLAAGTGTAQNRPWIILSYDLRTRKLKRIADYFGGGFDTNGTVSPAGQYLA